MRTGTAVGQVCSGVTMKPRCAESVEGQLPNNVRTNQT
jgi:hypothetical protein